MKPRKLKTKTKKCSVCVWVVSWRCWEYFLREMTLQTQACFCPASYWTVVSAAATTMTIKTVPFETRSSTDLFSCTRILIPKQTCFPSFGLLIMHRRMIPLWGGLGFRTSYGIQQMRRDCMILTIPPRPSSVTTNPQYPVLKPEIFAIHLDAQSFSHAIYQQTRATNGSLICHLLDDAQDNQHQQPQSLQTYLLRSFTQEKVSRLQKGLVEATYALSYFALSPRDQDEKSLPDSPLQRGILLSGAATHRLLGELAHRARHGKENWDKCQEEKTNILSQTGGKMVTSNKC